jgi:hypothetical protein
MPQKQRFGTPKMAVRTCGLNFRLALIIHSTIQGQPKENSALESLGGYIVCGCRELARTGIPVATHFE